MVGRGRLAPLAAAVALCAQAASAAALPDARWAALSGRLFPAVAALRGDHLPTAARAMLEGRRRRVAACAGDVPCVVAAARWSDDERRILIAAAPAALASAAYQAPDDGAGAEVERQLAGLNAILDVYGAGAAPRYPAIDGPGDDAPAALTAGRRAAAVALAAAGAGDPAVAIDPSLALGIALLDTADRCDAAAFDPVAREAQQALLRQGVPDWRRYRYTAIIVPGEGPDDLATPLSATGKLRVRLAAEAYADGAAPFVIVSGGAGHPRGARFVEAVEMRRALLERYGVPAAAVVIDPYARHTTTNLRNASRLLLALRAPRDREALIVTDPAQSRYIEGAVLKARNSRELGYQPGAIGARLSPTALTFRPSPSALRVDPTDPPGP